MTGDYPVDRHALMRTSSPYAAFIGTCVKCGLKNLTINRMQREVCSNPSGMTNDEALALAGRLSSRHA